MLLRARTWTLLAISLLSLNRPTYAVERSDVPEKYRWDLSALYADEAAWVAAKQQFLDAVPRVAAYQGKLGTSAAGLLEAMIERIYAKGTVK